VRHEDAKPVPGTGAREVERVFGVDIADELDFAKSTGQVGETVQIPISAPGLAAEALVLLGVGDGTPLAVRRAGAALARSTRGRHRLATTVVARAGDEAVRAFVEGLLLASYSFTRKSKAPEQTPLAQVDLVVGRPERRQAALSRALVTAAAVRRTRDLTNTPSNEKDPAWLARQAQSLARSAGLGVQVRDERQLAAEGFNGILAVGAGSARPPRLIELAYTPEGGGSGLPHIVLVGKGITFDTGGLSLKPREAMVPMKTDMAGGATVITVLAALAELEVNARVTGLVAAAENMPSGSAQRPGDVITHYGGTTVEVLNTDAEGRLVLADALAYADRRLDPDVLVDVATLTGAASLGLGRRHGAMYTPDDRLAASFAAAGDASGDRVWRMPLVADYRAALESPVADLAHIATDPHVQGGSIVAAMFLREFVGGRRWVHLDIAGPARADSDEHEITKGGTGFGTRLLLRWLESF
jgi:leucyl aminopeptidase